MKPALRINSIEEYYFSKKLAEVRNLQEQGAPILNIGIGNPDIPTHPDVIKELVHAAYQDGSNYYQSYRGIDKLREAMSTWYKNTYSVSLNAQTEILPLMGSKEAISHIHMAFCNPGDTVLIPNPGHPAYASSAKLLNLHIVYYNLKEENNWLPDYEELEKMSQQNIKLMWVNYPHMPSGAIAQADDFKKLADFAQKKNILLVNDNPYSLILNSNAKSILSYCQREQNVLELNSLSKSHNMAGWRVGMVSGKEELINHILTIKSNYDSGMFKPVQEAAVKALELEQNWYQDINIEYGQRRIVLWEFLDQLSCTYDKLATGMFVWARIPQSFINGEEFADYLLYEKSIFATPGMVFGSNGEKYIRFSLCAPISVFKESINRLNNPKTKHHES